ncbi:hypothetical protein FQN60_013669 [Etheostoma spectabile]|uniref:Alkylated DNA repair protein AlkB homologue 8 N-terminal domain-containing protein n=1 Tax=Etheostoma spectabile TaxID=54343 RepID=A0A5J5CKT8_9PERO|nr:hypothetical protein FQN60_013669 [Etheostoma spectabile]
MASPAVSKDMDFPQTQETKQGFRSDTVSWREAASATTFSLSDEISGRAGNSLTYISFRQTSVTIHSAPWAKRYGTEKFREEYLTSQLSCFKYLGVTISVDLTWSAHMQTGARKASQRVYHLRQLRKFGASLAILRSFYSATVESILTQSMAAWFGNSCKKDRKALQRVIRAAERCCSSALPSLEKLHQKMLE